MRQGELKFTAEEAAAIREAEQQAGYGPPPPAAAGLGTMLLEGVVAGGLDGLGTLLGAVAIGAHHGLTELGHAVDNFFRALFIGAAAAAAVGLMIAVVLTHGFESRPVETDAQVQVTGSQTEPQAQAARTDQLVPYEISAITSRVPEPTPSVVPVSLIEAQLKALPLREPAPLLHTTVAPPAPATDDTSNPEETARWQEPQTDEPPVLRRKGLPEPGSPTTVAQIQPRSESQVAPQSETTRSHTTGREVERDEADARSPQPHANKDKVKKPSRLRRVLSGVLTFEDFVFNQIDPMAEP